MVTSSDAAQPIESVTGSARGAVEEARALIADIPDPEIPVLTLEDLGILRGVHEDNGHLVVSLTPTYTGCPATEAIRDQVERTLAQAGHVGAKVRLTLSPPWSTDWISARGRRRLTEYGIAPPACTVVDLTRQGDHPGAGEVIRFMPRSAPRTKGDPAIACPRCASLQTEQLSAHSSTPCKALYRCQSCREPFDYFKPY
jgi:ring-1,2-phenylacetyl-CoA epoxidase subunit PaaD